MIACVSDDYGLGYHNQLIWQIPEDMKFFRQTTTGGRVAMGRKTFISIGHALPNRTNIVLSHHPSDISNITWCTSKSELDQVLENYDGQKFIIGGATLYNICINEVEKIYLTEVHAQKPADEFFPKFDQTNFSRRVIQDSEYNGIKYEIVEYSRK